MKIILAIPCYNCEKQIHRVLKSLSIDLCSEVYKVIIIDNCSTDNTLNSIKETVKSLDDEIKNKIELYQNLENYGLGGSFKTITEFSYAESSNYLAVLHGDDQGNIEDLLKIIRTDDIQQSKVDCVFGSRFMKDSKLIGYSKTRKYGNQFINLIFSIFTGKRIYDIGSGLNIYKTSSLPLEVIRNWPNHIAFDVNILLNYIKKKSPITFFPITWREYDQTSNAKNINTALLVLGMLFRFKLGLKNQSSKWNLKRHKKRIQL